MGTVAFSDEFKCDAVAQITEQGYTVSEVSERLGVSKHSLYAWKRKRAKTASGETEKDAEIRRLKRELARVKASGTPASMAVPNGGSSARSPSGSTNNAGGSGR